jgi:hypothetical protein
MDIKSFSFNSGAKYRTGGVFPLLPNIVKQLIHPNIQVQVDQSGAFQTQFLDVFQKYKLPYVTSDLIVVAWNSHFMQFWQNQLNFAVWCATTGCGVSSQDHLSSADPLVSSLYRFHVYYQVRRILKEIQAPLPQDQAWNAFNNPYDRRAYEHICNEFGVSPHTDWRMKGPNHGLGKVYNYHTRMGYYPVPDRGDYDSAKMSFTKRTTNEVLHIDYISQDTGDFWTTFILGKSHGFTRPGVERLNDSIRTYVWLILGAQAQTRTCILGTGTAFDAQKQFLANLEDAISSPVDLPSAIKRYQDTLQYAGSEVNFVFGIGLYMAPGDMLLRIGQVVGYNNEIVIATAAQTLGINTGVNATSPPPTSQGETGLVKPMTPTVVTPAPTVLNTEQHPKSAQAPHEAEKTALIVGGIAVGLLTLWLVRG